MALIPEETIAQVIDRSDIVEVVSSYIPLKRAGRNFKANCPFHNEKTPSFVINPDKQIFHCFGCGVGGNALTFVMKLDHLEFPEAIRMLAQKVNVTIPTESTSNSKTINERQMILNVSSLAVEYYHKVLLSSKAPAAIKARDYLKERDISLQAVKEFQLGFALDQWDGLLNFLREKNIPLALIEKAGLIIARENKEGYYDRFRNRILFPIFDTRKQCRAFGGRVLESDNTAKYINSPETIVYTKGHHLYGFHLAKQAISELDSVVIVEGYTDCIVPHQQGKKNIVASLGTALTIEQIRLLRRYTRNVVMLFDTDKAGESAIIRSLDLLVEEGMNVRVATLAEGEDPDSFVRQYGAEVFQERIDESETLFDYKFEVLKKSLDIAAVEGKAKIAGEMLTTIDRFPNAIIKEGYVKRLAQILGIAEDALLSEMKKIRQGNVATKRHLEDEPTKVRKIENVNRVESNILKLLLDEQSFIATTKDQVEVAHFQDKRIRNVISRIYELFDQGQEINVVNLVNSFEDPTIQEMITRLAAEDEALSADKEKAHRDCMNRIKKDRLKNQRQLLVEQIRQAEHSGEMEKLNELKTQFNQLIKD